MRNKWSTTLPGAGYKACIYIESNHSAAKIYTSKDSDTPIQTIPQITTKNDGLLEFWIDSLDYDIDDLLDIDILDPIGNYWTSKKKINVFKVRDYLENKGANLFNLTLDNDVTVESGQCMSIPLPQGQTLTIPDGVTLKVEDGAIFMLFEQQTSTSVNVMRWI